jgi:LacI family transcriptional regulator
MEKVQAVVKELGYASSLAARGMRSRRTNVIGMIFPDVASPYCHEIMRGVNRVIAQSERDLIIYTSGGGAKGSVAYHERSYVAVLNGGTADGVIVVTPTAATFSSHAPLVILDPNNESPDVPAVIATNREGSLAAMNYLTGLGHRRIGHITGRMELVSANQRLQGYKDGLEAAGIPYDETLVKIGDYVEDTAFQCAQMLLSLQGRPTAIFAANDMSAMGVYRAAKAAGLQIPQDLSVIGFDNLRESAFTLPALTTVDQFLEEMGAVATVMLERLINNEKLPHKLQVIQTQLILRNSCAPPPKN